MWAHNRTVCVLAASAEPVAFVHVNVIPMDQERVLTDHTVIVQAGRIVEIGPAASTHVPNGANRIDAGGQYLMPALADMHIHMLGQAWNIMFPPEAQFPLLSLIMEILSTIRRC